MLEGTGTTSIRPGASSDFHHPAKSLFTRRGFVEIAFSTCASVAFLLTAAYAAFAQQPGQNPPRASTVAMLAGPESTSAYLRNNPVPTEGPVEVPRWYQKSDNQVAIVLAVAEAVDLIGTYENMTHSQWLCGYDPTLGAEYRISGSTYMPNSGPGKGLIAIVCGPSPFGPNENYAEDVTSFDGSFTEAGWAAKFVNNRNYTGVELLNVALDGAGLAAGRLIPNRGKMRWVKAATTALNYVHAVGHLCEGTQNIRYVHSPNQAANNFFETRPNSAFYTITFPGPRWWGKQ